MDKIRVWRYKKFRTVRIQIASGTVSVGERFGFNFVIANKISIVMNWRFEPKLLFSFDLDV